MSAVACEPLSPIDTRRPDPADVDRLIEAVLARIDRTLPQFVDLFPAPASEDGV